MTKMGKFCWLKSKYVPIEHQPGSLLSYIMYNIEYLCITHFISSHYFPLLIGYHLCMQYYFIIYGLHCKLFYFLLKTATLLNSM